MYEEMNQIETYTLNCIDRERGSEGIFQISIGKDNEVHELKQWISKRHSNTFAGFAYNDSFDIKLWKVNDDQIEGILSSGAVENVLDGKEMLDSEKIGEIFSNSKSLTGDIYAIIQGWCNACDEGYNSLKNHQESNAHKDHDYYYDPGEIITYEEEEEMKSAKKRDKGRKREDEDDDDLDDEDEEEEEEVGNDDNL